MYQLPPTGRLVTGSRIFARHHINPKVTFLCQTQCRTFRGVGKHSLPMTPLPETPSLRLHPTLKRGWDTVSYVKSEDPLRFWQSAWLRDSCGCSKCVDPSTRQKTFRTTDIPIEIRPASCEHQENGNVKITWENDIPGFGPDHVSTFTKEFFNIHHDHRSYGRDRGNIRNPRPWNTNLIKQRLRFINYDDYMNDDKFLLQALLMLKLHGMLIIRGVPGSETSVEELATRIGRIRDTFYGRTWDVKSVPQAKNVAYTHQHLGLHMDLLYMANPPGLQLLHCIKNSSNGGSSLFSDSFFAASQLSHDDFVRLCNVQIGYHYKNAGEHYYFAHPLIQRTTPRTNDKLGVGRPLPEHINYSPPFQANFVSNRELQQVGFSKNVLALREFVDHTESRDNVLEYRLNEGECVIFNNRRILHGRGAFNPAEGDRWLKGTYVDTDVFESRWRTLSKKLPLPRTHPVHFVFSRSGRSVGPEDIANDDPNDDAN